MKNIRKFISAVVAVCCCASFVGCGESAGKSSEEDLSSQTKYEENDSDSEDSEDKDTDEQEEETTEESDESDEDEDTDEQEEKITVKKTESSFTPQFADESELRKSEWLNSDDKTNAGYSIIWYDSPCIGKSVAVDGNEIFGGETLGDCDFKNWSVTYDYDKGDESLESNATANHIYYSHSDFKKPEDESSIDNLNLRPMSSLYCWELMQMDLYNDTSSDKTYNECKISSFELGGYGEVGDEGSVNVIEYYGMTEAVESTVELPYGVTWDMGPYDVYDILGTPYHFNTVNEDNPNGRMWVMDYYTIDKYHTITFTFNPEQDNRLCTVKVHYDYTKD